MSKSDITYISSLRSSIEKLSKWDSSGAAFGFIETVDDANPDYIYEFFCAMKILEDLNHNHRIEIKPGSFGYIFPQKPGLKSNWARFILFGRPGSSDPQFQACLGIKIKITASPNTTFSADFSIHKGTATDDPYDSDIILIMDAKYKDSKNTKIDIGIIREFAQCVRDMNTPKSEAEMLIFNKLGILRANCLLTNGVPDESHQQYCINNKLKQVGSFDIDGSPMVVVG